MCLRLTRSPIQGHIQAFTVSPKFQGSPTGISIVINDLCQTRVPVSGYILINRSASACSASASVTW